MPQNIITREKVSRRTEEVFEGIDLSRDNKVTIGPVDFKVTIARDEMNATAEVHGFRVASMSKFLGDKPGEYVDLETFHLGGVIEGRGDVEIYLRKRTSGEKFTVTIPPLGGLVGYGTTQHPDEFDEINLKQVAELLKIK